MPALERPLSDDDLRQLRVETSQCLWSHPRLKTIAIVAETLTDIIDEALARGAERDKARAAVVWEQNKYDRDLAAMREERDEALIRK